MEKINPDRVKEVVSVTTKYKGQLEDFVFFACPEPGCEWHTGDWSVKYEDEARYNYKRHWLDTHAPQEPDPLTERWSG